MPKIKNRRAASKRFSVTSSGKVRCNHANKSHILTKKTRARKNKLKKAKYVTKGYKNLVLKCLPNR